MTVDDKSLSLAAEMPAQAIAPSPEEMSYPVTAVKSFNQDIEAQGDAPIRNDYYFCGPCIPGCGCDGPPPSSGWCGLEVEQRPDFVWVKEDFYALILSAVLGSMCALFTLAWYLFPEQLEVFKPPPFSEFLRDLPLGLFLTLVFYPLGIPVWYFGISVAFTRKVTHTLMMTLIPLAAINAEHDGDSLPRKIFMSATWMAFGTCFVLSIVWLVPFRKYCHVLRLSFAAIERTEDRPLALFFVNMQSTAMTMVQTPMMQWMIAENKGLLIFIPFFSVAFGDGLAEPIGRMYGKHKYEVYALGTDKKYTRSYEGSAVVFFFSLVACFIALPQMTWLQFALCVLIIPAANTYAEAKSPHTFDNHIMFGVTWLLLFLIFDVVAKA